MSTVIQDNKNEIAEFDEFRAKLEEFKNRYEGVVYDLDDPDQDKQARSDRYAIGQTISRLDAAHKALKAPLAAQVSLIDGARKEIKDELLKTQNGIKRQIEEYERKKREHEEMLQGKIDEITALSSFDPMVQPDATLLAGRLTEARSLDIDDAYEHRKEDAEVELAKTTRKLEALYAERLKYEEEQAELERLRKEKEERERAAREEQIRMEAEARARREAEEAAQRKIEEARQKQRNAELAAERAAQEERERIECEQREEAQRKADEEAKENARKEKQAYRSKVHARAKKCFIANGLSDEDATKIVVLIKDGKINNVKIEY